MLIEQDNHLDFSCNPHALIISPTRELSLQIFNEARKFSVGTNLKVAIIYGATSVAYQLNNIKVCININLSLRILEKSFLLKLICI